MLGAITAIGAIANVGLSIWGASKADKAADAAAEKERKARAEMKKLRAAYANLDTSNPFLNMQNVFENLTINQKQFELQNQQFQQSQANILSGLRGAAGGSGIAALAQSLAQQGQIASQQSAAEIGQQEQRNQMLALQEDARIQDKEIQGEMYSRGLEKDKIATLLGMSQSESAAYGQQVAQAEEAKWGAISSGVQGFTNLAGSWLQGR